ncbi:putative cytochrome P450 [Gordonia effusa NBRC 100432]|uniref:Putative cytochrome P450 n=1 Tax=Gordonia effusa NBRC 100432 TaxID=1077974 RepID=H0R3N1_9ACTN|nr:cytochrome P450 [Gordonia effusa]GAB19682.1 putative cytochrome P450 [Gordonia effusa NBRC 100432]
MGGGDRLNAWGVGKHWVRWVAKHGVARIGFRALSKRGDPYAQLMTDAGGSGDPYPAIERIRANGPLASGLAGLITADHEISREVLRDKRFVTLAIGNLPLPKTIKWIFRATEPGLPNPVESPAMLAVDPPVHTRYRKLVSRAFTPRALAALDTRIREVTEQLLDDLAGKPQVDLVADYAAKLPVAIIAEMLGVPLEHAPKLLKWGGHGSVLLDVGISWGAYRQASDSLVAFDHFLDEHIASLRASRNDGILGTVIAEGDLNPRELKVTAALLLGAGFETTVNLIGNGIVALQRHPDQLDALRSDPSLWPNAIEEILRFDSPVQLTGRVAKDRIELSQKIIEKGEVVVTLLGGANRDPAVFANPDKFDVARDNARDHLAFSSGVHVCLGASLARMEGIIALQSLTERYPDLRLTGPPVHRGLVNLHGYEQLPAQVGTRSRAITQAD